MAPDKRRNLSNRLKSRVVGHLSSGITGPFCGFDEGCVELDKNRVGGGVLRVTCQAACRYCPELRGGSNVHNLEAPFKALHRIITHRRPPLVGYKSGVSEIGDGVRDEPEV